MNREALLSLHAQRKEIDTKKINLDKLQLQLENLRYKEAHLSREIRDCKNLPTPSLAEVEAELARCLGTTQYSEKLSDINKEAKEQLTNEMYSRIKARQSLGDIETAAAAAVDKLDKKRKFLEDLPAKMEAIKATTNELSKQFIAILDPISIASDDKASSSSYSSNSSSSIDMVSDDKGT